MQPGAAVLPAIAQPQQVGATVLARQPAANTGGICADSSRAGASAGGGASKTGCKRCGGQAATVVSNMLTW
eukprot:364500-Chlamydomonas_euryale.AAC.31